MSETYVVKYDSMNKSTNYLTSKKEVFYSLQSAMDFVRRLKTKGIALGKPILVEKK